MYGAWRATGKVQWTPERDGLRIVNEVEYTRKAMNGDESTAIERAGSRLIKRISQKLEEKFR